ncbi:uridine 5'-monophosphate transferase XopAC [Xanthomonas campestris]|uniref:uridine 5'-monophosphate transferase XopAC n=2 Tax=Xanthomonas campestris TaxID=339 RepID=UPI00096ED937|nr:Fic family protein [Xanthomonas campestris pv. raphani]QLC69406.1 Fic family protein [Xanthomonas campestris pv. raphani]WDJ16842.1 Fic family protein [Xanthomonas campestris pv. raphani]
MDKNLNLWDMSTFIQQYGALTADHPTHTPEDSPQTVPSPRSSSAHSPEIQELRSLQETRPARLGARSQSRSSKHGLQQCSSSPSDESFRLHAELAAWCERVETKPSLLAKLGCCAAPPVVGDHREQRREAMERIMRCLDAGQAGTQLTLRDLNLSQLPPGLHRLAHLRDLDVADNVNLTRLPEDLSLCKHLERINADGCSIAALPSKIGALKNLSEISLAFNELRTLPDSIGQCSSLTTIVVPGCKINKLPASLANLTQLKKLDVAANIELSELSPHMNLDDVAVHSTQTRLGLMHRIFKAPTFDPETRQRLSYQASALRDRWAALSHHLSPQARARVDQMREGASTTLSSQDHKASAAWKTATEKVSSWAEEGAPITLDRIFKLNQLLLPEGDDENDPIGGQLRKVGVQAAPSNTWTECRYPPPETLKDEMAKFSGWLEHSEQQAHARDALGHIEFAAQLHQRLVSLHPFDDANGRTARLAMDWALQRHGLPPAPPVGEASRRPASFLGGKRVSPEKVVLETLEGIATVMNQVHQ